MTGNLIFTALFGLALASMGLTPDLSKEEYRNGSWAVSSNLPDHAETPGLAKLKPEDVVARHLASIGTAEARAAIQTRMIEGTVVMTLRSGGTGTSEGTAHLASEGEKSLIWMVFQSLDYPHEKLSYDGNRFNTVPQQPGFRSPLDQILHSYPFLFREGLIGGTLSSAWPLLNLQPRKPRLQYAGTKKIDNSLVHEIHYSPSKAHSDTRISLYFEDGSFRHVRSQYRMVISAMMGQRPEDSARQREYRFGITEIFGDFVQENGLTYPRFYKLQLNSESQNRTIMHEWDLKLSRFTFNQPLDPSLF